MRLWSGAVPPALPRHGPKWTAKKSVRGPTQLRCRAAYVATFARFPQICILHHRRVPFLLVSKAPLMARVWGLLWGCCFTMERKAVAFAGCLPGDVRSDGNSTDGVGALYGPSSVQRKQSDQTDFISPSVAQDPASITAAVEFRN